MRAALLVVAAIAALLTPGTPAAAAGDPELGPLISGEVSYVDGTFVWTDYVYDDRGANTNGIPGGDASYGSGPGNTADIVQVQLGTAPDGSLRVTTVLNSMVDGTDVTLLFGFDTDLDRTTGDAELWTSPEPMGLDEVVEIRTSDTSYTVDRGANVVQADIAALRPGTSTWKVVVVALDGEEIMDLAFVRAEDPPTEPLVNVTMQVPQIRQPWQDEIQADVLAGKLPPSLATASVTFGTDRTAPSEPNVPGLNTFLYHSRVDAGEGAYAGLYEPYVALIPDGLPDPAPAINFVHGANQNHLVNAVHFTPSGLVITGFHAVRAVVLFPRAGRPGAGSNERDILDVTDDATARLGLDPDRIVLSGISNGGILTYSLGARYPDRWTGLYSIVGTNSILGSGAPLENLTAVPFRAHNGTFDPLVNALFWTLDAQALDAVGTVDYRTALIHTSSHVPAPEGNCWYEDLLSRPRETSPGRVRYTVQPSRFVVDPDRGLDIRPRGAYWVSELVSRDGANASIDARSLAAPQPVMGGEIDETAHNVLTGVDFCGLHPNMQRGQVWTQQGRVFGPSAAPVENALDLSLSNLAAATIDVDRALIATDRPVTVTTAGDGATTITLVGSWPASVEVQLGDADPVSVDTSGGALVLDDDGSGRTYTIVP